jgi:hypothetical protein
MLPLQDRVFSPVLAIIRKGAKGMFEKVQIIYDYDGYADPKIKDVKVARVNGYKTIIKKEGENKMTDNKKFMRREEKVENYISTHPNVDYRTAVLKSGVGVEEDFSTLAPDEVVRLAKLCDDAIASINLLKDSNVFGGTTQTKYNQAYQRGSWSRWSAH